MDPDCVQTLFSVYMCIYRKFVLEVRDEKIYTYYIFYVTSDRIRVAYIYIFISGRFSK